MYRKFDGDDQPQETPRVQGAVPALAGREQREERSAYGQCLMCGCSAFWNDGTGDCRCGHDFGSHY